MSMSVTNLYNNPRKVSFRDSLFESISTDMTIPLDFKVVAYQLQKDLEPILLEMAQWFERSQKILFEADAPEDTQATIEKFVKNYNNLSNVDIQGIDAALKGLDSGVPPKGLMNKLFNLIKRALDKVNELSMTRLDDKIQAAIAKIYDKTDDNLGKQLLRALGKIGKVGGYIATAVLLLAGVASVFSVSIPGMGLVLGHLLMLKIIAVIVRVAVDIGSGKSILYAFGKSALLWGAGVKAQEAAQSVLDYFNQTMPAISARGPDAPINTGGGSPANVNLGTVDTPGGALAGGGQFSVPTPDAMPSAPLTTPLQQAYGEPIKNYTGDFQKAFASARNELGSGKLFHWGDDVYPTNYEEEGIFKGLSNAVKTMLQKGIK